MESITWRKYVTKTCMLSHFTKYTTQYAILSTVHLELGGEHVAGHLEPSADISY